MEKFLETGPHVARYIEEHTSFGWIPTIWPDYRSDIDGASVGRALFPGPYSPEGLGDAKKFREYIRVRAKLPDGEFDSTSALPAFGNKMALHRTLDRLRSCSRG